jgi:hypothetical protein
MHTVLTLLFVLVDCKIRLATHFSSTLVRFGVGQLLNFKAVSDERRDTGVGTVRNALALGLRLGHFPRVHVNPESVRFDAGLVQDANRTLRAFKVLSSPSMTRSYQGCQNDQYEQELPMLPHHCRRCHCRRRRCRRCRVRCHCHRPKFCRGPFNYFIRSASFVKKVVYDNIRYNSSAALAGHLSRDRAYHAIPRA